MFDDGVVGHTADAGEGGYGAVECFGGEIAQGEGFVSGEAGGAELFVGAVEDLLGGWVCGLRVSIQGGDFKGKDRGEAFEQAAVDGGCGLAVELLVDDGFEEGLEGGLGSGDAHGEGAGAGDELGEFGVGCGQVLQGRIGVVRGLAGACGVHGGSLVQFLFGGGHDGDGLGEGGSPR
jgi:hypothetical protein